jgi:hypothetical protein
MFGLINPPTILMQQFNHYLHSLKLRELVMLYLALFFLYRFLPSINLLQQAVSIALLADLALIAVVGYRQLKS